MKLLGRMRLSPGRDGQHLALDLSHNSSRSVAILFRFHSGWPVDPVRDGKAGRMICELYPFVRVRLSLDLGIMQEGSGFHARPVAVGILYNSGPLKRVADIDSVSILVHEPPAGFRLRVGRMRLSRRPVRPALLAPRSALVDRFGRLKPVRWPGKVRDPGPEVPAGPPLAIPRFQEGGPPSVAGKFGVARRKGRWWLVSPEGERFFSSGVTCVRSNLDSGPIAGTESLYEWLPPRDNPLYSAAVRGGPHDRKASVCFYAANLARRYGPSWRVNWAALACDRLLDWGFNTIANWSDELAIARRLLPYTINAGWWDVPGPRGIFGGFPDVFDPSFERSCDAAARAGCRPNDPLLIGYFVHNEPQWGHGRVNLAERALSVKGAPATRRFVLGWLRSRGINPARAGEAHFGKVQDLLIDRYLRTACGALRKYDPGRLLLGIRYAGAPPAYMVPPMRHMDVVTINSYQRLPDRRVIEGLSRATGKPVLIGEFHFGATDRNNTFYGLQGVASQRDRGLAFARYMEAAADIPCVVGAHWFQYSDQHVMGRFDGENYNIGMVDVTDRPYPEMAAASRAFNVRLPLIHAGELKPRNLNPKYVDNGLVW